MTPDEVSRSGESVAGTALSGPGVPGGGAFEYGLPR